MTNIGFATTEAALLKGAKRLVLVAPAATLSKLPTILDKKLRDLVKQLAKDAKPGDNGGTSGTLTGVDAPRRLVVGALPDRVSHHNSPARAEAIRNVVKRAAIGGAGKTAVLFVLDDPEHMLPACNALARTLPLYSCKGGGGDKKSGSVQILAVTKKGLVVRASAAVKATVESTREAARLVDTPPTDMNPAVLARDAKALLRGIPGVRTREIVGADLLKNGLGGIHGVGRCAVEAPRMLVATYTPKRGKGKHIALVGKGVTYDTGGLNIKVGGFMSGMKADMGGSAAVLGAFRVLASTGCKHKLSLIMCIAENAIGPEAFKPDDILSMHSGKTVEINNTDAEGRLLLGDGVSWATRKLGVDYVFDAATLTGAQLIATGRLHAAVVCNDAALESLVVDAGRASGDLCHAMPFAPEFYRKEFASQVADMKNSVKDRKNAQSSCAAQFVYAHMEDQDAKWCHVDMAGPAKLGERATGYGVALLAEAVRRL